MRPMEEEEYRLENIKCLGVKNYTNIMEIGNFLNILNGQDNSVTLFIFSIGKNIKVGGPKGM